MKTLEDLREQFEDGEIVSLPPGTPGSVQFLGPNMHSAMFSGLNIVFRGGQFTTNNEELISKFRGLTRRNVGITEVVGVQQPNGVVVAVATKELDAAAQVTQVLQSKTAENATQVLKGEEAAGKANALNPAAAAIAAASRAAGNAPQVN